MKEGSLGEASWVGGGWGAASGGDPVEEIPLRPPVLLLVQGQHRHHRRQILFLLGAER